jgi:hypothetical protein
VRDVIVPVFKKPRLDAMPTITARLQAVASVSLLRQPVSVAEREPKTFVAPPAVLNRWSEMLLPLLNLFKRSIA